MNFALFLEMHARGRPDALVLVDRRHRYTYAELDALANRFANFLNGMGLTDQDRVAIYMPNRAEMVLALLGAFKSGVIAVPLNWRLATADLAAPLAHIAPSVVVTTEELAANIPGGHTVLTCGDGKDDGTFWDALRGRHEGFRSVGRQAADIANLLMTSGTTSTPKAAIHTHGMRVAMAATMADCFKMSCLDVGLAVSPLFHTGGFSVFANALFCGGTLVLQEKWDVEEFASLLIREGVTYMHLVTTLVVDIVRAPATLFDGFEKTVRFTWGGGHSADPSLFEEFERRVGGTFSQGYSRTEGGITYNPLDRQRRSFATNGTPNRNNSLVAVLDPKTAFPRSDGGVGEIAVAGDGVSPGYWDRDKVLTLSPKGGIWQPTGDLGRLDPDGSLIFLGREDHLIKTGGENVYPSEVLDVLLSLEGVSDAVVVGVPDERLGSCVAALIVPTSDDLTAEEVNRRCRGSLAGFKVPRRIAIVPSLPRLGSGKVDLASCKAHLAGLRQL